MVSCFFICCLAAKTISSCVMMKIWTDLTWADKHGLVLLLVIIVLHHINLNLITFKSLILLCFLMFFCTDLISDILFRPKKKKRIWEQVTSLPSYALYYIVFYWSNTRKYVFGLTQRDRRSESAAQNQPLCSEVIQLLRRLPKMLAYSSSSLSTHHTSLRFNPSNSMFFYA